MEISKPHLLACLESASSLEHISFFSKHRLLVSEYSHAMLNDRDMFWKMCHYVILSSCKHHRVHFHKHGRYSPPHIQATRHPTAVHAVRHRPKCHYIWLYLTTIVWHKQTTNKYSQNRVFLLSLDTQLYNLDGEKQRLGPFQICQQFSDSS